MKFGKLPTRNKYHIIGSIVSTDEMFRSICGQKLKKGHVKDINEEKRLKILKEDNLCERCFNIYCK